MKKFSTIDAIGVIGIVICCTLGLASLIIFLSALNRHFGCG